MKNKVVDSDYIGRLLISYLRGLPFGACSAVSADAMGYFKEVHRRDL